MMLGGGGDGEGISGRLAMVASLQAQMNPAMGAVEMTATSGGGAYPQQQQQQQQHRGKEERVPQWSQQETRDLIAARADMERDPPAAAMTGSVGTRRNKTLWEAVAARMRERGYRRTPDQCKCKWKNLVNRYKGKETADPETGRQCPFFEELHAVFNERARNMQRLLLESEASGVHAKKKLKRHSREQSSDEFSEDDNEDDEDSDKEDCRAKSRKKRNDARAGHQQQRAKISGNSIHELLQDFLQQQQRVEMQWHDMMERRAQERQAFQQEWRQSMEKLENERLLLERSWREREEQRRIREESRAEKRDVLLTALLNKLIQDDL